MDFGNRTTVNIRKFVAEWVKDQSRRQRDKKCQEMTPRTGVIESAGTKTREKGIPKGMMKQHRETLKTGFHSNWKKIFI